MKKLFSVLLACLMVFGLVACSSKTEEKVDEEGGEVSTTSEPVTITVGTSPDYEPYESLDTNGEVVGFDVEMLKAFETYLSEEYGTEYKFELVQMSFDNIITQIQGGQVMIGVSGFSYDEERANAVDFTSPYCGSKQVAMVLADSEISSLADLEGKHLAAQTGTTGFDAAVEIDADCASIANVLDMVPGLDGNQYDAIIVDGSVAESYASTGNYKVLDEALVDEANYIVVKKGDEDTLNKLNECIAKFVASDEYKTLCEEYGITGIEG